MIRAGSTPYRAAIEASDSPGTTTCRTRLVAVGVGEAGSAVAVGATGVAEGTVVGEGAGVGALSVGDASGVGDADGEAEGDAVGDTVGLGSSVGVGVAVGSTVGVSVAGGVAVRVAVGPATWAPGDTDPPKLGISRVGGSRTPSSVRRLSQPMTPMAAMRSTGMRSGQSRRRRRGSFRRGMRRCGARRDPEGTLGSRNGGGVNSAMNQRSSALGRRTGRLPLAAQGAAG